MQTIDMNTGFHPGKLLQVNTRIVLCSIERDKLGFRWSRCVAIKGDIILVLGEATPSEGRHMVVLHKGTVHCVSRHEILCDRAIEIQ